MLLGRINFYLQICTPTVIKTVFVLLAESMIFFEKFCSTLKLILVPSLTIYIFVALHEEICCSLKEKSTLKFFCGLFSLIAKFLRLCNLHDCTFLGVKWVFCIACLVQKYVCVKVQRDWFLILRSRTSMLGRSKIEKKWKLRK